MSLVKEKKYARQYGPVYTVPEALGSMFCKWDTDIEPTEMDPTRKSPFTTLRWFLVQFSTFEMQKEGRPCQRVDAVLHAKFAQKLANEKKRSKKAN